jgi:hypothetical protein
LNHCIWNFKQISGTFLHNIRSWMNKPLLASVQTDLLYASEPSPIFCRSIWVLSGKLMWVMFSTFPLVRTILQTITSWKATFKTQKRLAQAVTLVTCIREVIGSNLGRTPIILTQEFRGFSHLSRVNVGIVPYYVINVSFLIFSSSLTRIYLLTKLLTYPHMLLLTHKHRKVKKKIKFSR